MPTSNALGTIPQTGTKYYLLNELKLDENDSSSCLVPVGNAAGSLMIVGDQILNDTNCMWQFITSETEGCVYMQHIGSSLYLMVQNSRVSLSETAYNWILVATDDTEDEIEIKNGANDTEYLAAEVEGIEVVISSGDDPVVKEKDRKWKYSLATVGF